MVKPSLVSVTKTLIDYFLNKNKGFLDVLQQKRKMIEKTHSFVYKGYIYTLGGSIFR